MFHNLLSQFRFQRYFSSCFLLSVLLFFAFIPLSAHSSPTTHSETILFCTTGFTNKIGVQDKQSERAIAAGKYLAQKQLERFLKHLLRSEGLTQLPQDWEKGITILNNRPIPSEDPRSNNFFGMILTGILEIKLPERSDETYTIPDSSILQVDFSSTKTDYLEGEEIIFSFEGNQNFYASILDLNHSNELIQLLPNAYRTDNSFAGHLQYSFPQLEAGDDFRLEVAPPFGTEKVHLIASTMPFDTVLPIREDSVFPYVKDDISSALEPIHKEMIRKIFSKPSSSLYQEIQISTKILTLTTHGLDSQN